jgi:hypothetical protein
MTMGLGKINGSMLISISTAEKEIPIIVISIRRIPIIFIVCKSG